jgi:hypothetical protein
MTHTGATAPRKRRWIGLWLPWAAAGLLVVAWSLIWLWLRGETERGIEAAATGLRAHGGQAAWSSLTLGGYPFRLDVEAANLRLAEPSGWSVSLPSLRAEAYAFAPTRWILATDQGLTFTRPGEGPVRIASPLMRASINGWDQHPPRISFVGDDLTFAAVPGGAFPLAGAKAVQVYTRAGPDDQGALFVEVDGGAAAPGTDLARLAGAGPVRLTLDAILSHASAFAVSDWRSAVVGWTRAGGQLSVRRLAFAAGGASLEAQTGSVTVDNDARLVGEIDATLTAQNRSVPARLSLRGDGLWLGPARIAGSPRVYLLCLRTGSSDRRACA